MPRRIYIEPHLSFEGIYLLLRTLLGYAFSQPNKAIISDAKNREKFYFLVLTENFNYVIIILMRKNYLIIS